MNMLMVTTDYDPIEGGIATLSRETARALADAGHSVLVVAPYVHGAGVEKTREGLTVVRYRGHNLGWFRLVPVALKTLRYIRQADVVLAMNVAYGGVIGWSCARLLRRPYVAFAYGYEFLKFTKVPIIRSFIRDVYRRAAFVTAISSFTASELADFGLPSDRVRVILPGAVARTMISHETIQTIRERFVLDGQRIVLSVGRMVPRKGHKTLLEALPMILEKRADTIAIFVGRGPNLTALSRRASELGLRDRIRLPGRVSDEELAALYRLCDVFALPTGAATGGQVEGFGLVFSEAHAQAKPVVAGRTGGVEEAVLNGETGLLVEPGDSAALATAILELLRDDDRAHSLGMAGRARIESELNWANFVRLMVEELEIRI